MNGYLVGTFLLIVALSGLRIAREYERGVVFRLGRFAGVRGPGLFYVIPLGIERSRIMDLRTNTRAVEQQETITKDSVTITVNAVLWYRVADPAKAIISVADFESAVYQVALTSLRNVIGQHVLDEVLRERAGINAKLRAMIDESIEPWGLIVSLVEMKDVEIPVAMQRAMAREAEAVREKRARVIKASAEFEASKELAAAASAMSGAPGSLELRRFQMIAEVGAENNSTTLVMIPAEFTELARTVAAKVRPAA